MSRLDELFKWVSCEWSARAVKSMATSSDATDTDPYAYTYADRPGEYYAP